MYKKYRNIYQKCRICAGITQTEAAEALHISIESMRAYEAGQRVPPPDIVDRMVELYGDATLAVGYVRSLSGTVAQMLPDVEPANLMTVAIRIYNSVRSFAAGHSVDRLMRIAEDGVIDDDERPKFDAIIAEMRQMMGLALELSAFCRKEDNHDHR